MADLVHIVLSHDYRRAKAPCYTSTVEATFLDEQQAVKRMNHIAAELAASGETRSIFNAFAVNPMRQRMIQDDRRHGETHAKMIIDMRGMILARVWCIQELPSERSDGEEADIRGGIGRAELARPVPTG